MNPKSSPWIIPYFTAGYPSLKITESFVEQCEKAGMDAVELGVPFSDPIADGPTIQFSSHEALKKGTTLLKVLSTVKKLRHRGVRLPIFLMSYFNPIYNMGLNMFAREAYSAGVSGIVIPDIIFEESQEFRSILSHHHLGLVYLVSPTTDRVRAKIIAELSNPFLYIISVTGVTGARKTFSKNLKSLIHTVRPFSKGPVCVGFGISDPTQAQRAVHSGANGVIVGSALIEKIRHHQDPIKLLIKIKQSIPGNKYSQFKRRIS